MATIEEIKELLNSKFKERDTLILKEVDDKLKRSCETEVDNVIKKRKIGEQITFKRQANKDQFSLNEKVMKCLDSAEKSLLRGDGPECLVHINAGKELLEERRRHILIADREKHGWNVIRHYKSDNLAVDEDDERRLLRSRKAADFDKKQRETSLKRRYNGARRGYNNNDNRSERQSSYNRDNKYFNNNNKPSFDRSCFICGKFGHFQNSCPDKYGK